MKTRDADRVDPAQYSIATILCADAEIAAAHSGNQRRPSHDGPTAHHLAADSRRTLSAWISRHANFHGGTPLTALRHGLPEASSFGPIDLSLSKAQANRIAGTFGVTTRLVLSLSFADAPKAAHRFISKKPMLLCVRFTQRDVSPPPVLRSQLQGWRVTCPHCGEAYQANPNRHGIRALAPCLAVVRRGETRLHNDLDRWLPPLEDARLLLMRRIPWPPPRNGNFGATGSSAPSVPILMNISPKKQRSRSYQSTPFCRYTSVPRFWQARRSSSAQVLRCSQ